MKIFVTSLIFVASVIALKAESFDEMLERKITRMNPISFQEGQRRLDAFRKFRYAGGGYSFKFQLIDLPRRGRAYLTHSGTLLGDWNEKGPVMRVEFDDGKRLLLQGGFHPKIWMKEGDGPVRELSYEQWFRPIFEDSNFTPFDFSLNFIFWDYSNYEGPDKVKGRPAQRFLMKLPDYLAQSNPQLGGAYLQMDDAYNVILGAELLDRDNRQIRSYKLLNFQEVRGQYILKGIDVVDNETRHKTRFYVTAAAMGLAINREVFEPQGLVGWDSAVDKGRYQYLD